MTGADDPNSVTFFSKHNNDQSPTLAETDEHLSDFTNGLARVVSDRTEGISERGPRLFERNVVFREVHTSHANALSVPSDAMSGNASDQLVETPNETASRYGRATHRVIHGGLPSERAWSVMPHPKRMK